MLVPKHDIRDALHELEAECAGAPDTAAAADGDAPPDWRLVRAVMIAMTAAVLAIIAGLLVAGFFLAGRAPA